MPPSDPERLALYDRMTELLGPERADTLMESLPPISWDQIATKADLAVLKTEIDSRFTEIDAKIDGGFAKIDGQFTAISAEFTAIIAEFTALRGEMEGMKGRIDRRVSREIRNFAFATMGMILATTTPIWVTLLLNPTG